MWGTCCFQKGDIKVTLGTGSFLNVNTGSECSASILGLYPLVATKTANDIIYMMEGASNDTGSTIEWAMNFGEQLAMKFMVSGHVICIIIMICFRVVQ